jgi:hypothetical protein
MEEHQSIPMKAQNSFKTSLDVYADVVNYSVLMAYTCGLDLDEIIQTKISRNNEKYPVEKAYGSKEKYNKLK